MPRLLWWAALFSTVFPGQSPLLLAGSLKLPVRSLHSQLVERTADFPAAFERALQADTDALIKLGTDSEGITRTHVVGTAPAVRYARLKARLLNRSRFDICKACC